jgi:hypothetical protein
MSKICSKCELPKDLEAFYKRSSSPDGKANQCKVCDNKIRQNSRMLKEYKLSETDYEVLKKVQNNSCAICGTHQKHLLTKLAVDHNHSTGTYRGLLCGACNRALGLLKDDISMLEKSIMYLRSHACD